MAQNNDTIKCLAAMLVVGGGFLIAHATLGYYRETEFGFVVARGLGLLIGVLGATPVLAGIVWGVAFGVIGGQNRGTFQVIWVYVSCFLLLFYALGISSELHKMGVLFGEFRDRDVVKGLDLLKWIVLFAPYAAIFTALSILHSQEESEAARAQRLQNLSYAEMQVTMLRPAARRSDVISMAIGLMLGAVTGFIYYLKAHDGFTAALVFVLGGLLAGFGVAMMMPSQRQYRKAEKLRQQLRKP